MDSNKASEKLIDELIALRKEQKINQTNMALEIGISAEHLSRIERKVCSPTLNTLLLMIQFFKKDITLTNVTSESSVA